MPKNKIKRKQSQMNSNNKIDNQSSLNYFESEIITSISNEIQSNYAYSITQEFTQQLIQFSINNNKMDKNLLQQLIRLISYQNFKYTNLYILNLVKIHQKLLNQNSLNIVIENIVKFIDNKLVETQKELKESSSFNIVKIKFQESIKIETFGNNTKFQLFNLQSNPYDQDEKDNFINELEPSIVISNCKSAIIYSNECYYVIGNNKSGLFGQDESQFMQLTQCNSLNKLNVLNISMGKEHTVIQLKDNTVMSSGNNQYGQCGLNSNQYIQKNFTNIFQKDRNLYVKDFVCNKYGTVFMINKNEQLVSGKNQQKCLGSRSEDDCLLLEKAQTLKKFSGSKLQSSPLDFNIYIQGSQKVKNSQMISLILFNGNNELVFEDKHRLFEKSLIEPPKSITGCYPYVQVQSFDNKLFKFVQYDDHLEFYSLYYSNVECISRFQSDVYVIHNGELKIIDCDFNLNANEWQIKVSKGQSIIPYQDGLIVTGQHQYDYIEHIESTISNQLLNYQFKHLSIKRIHLIKELNDEGEHYQLVKINALNLYKTLFQSLVSSHFSKTKLIFKCFIEFLKEFEIIQYDFDSNNIDPNIIMKQKEYLFTKSKKNSNEIIEDQEIKQKKSNLIIAENLNNFQNKPEYNEQTELSYSKNRKSSKNQTYNFIDDISNLKKKNEKPRNKIKQNNINENKNIKFDDQAWNEEDQIIKQNDYDGIQQEKKEDSNHKEKTNQEKYNKNKNNKKQSKSSPRDKDFTISQWNHESVKLNQKVAEEAKTIDEKIDDRELQIALQLIREQEELEQVMLLSLDNQ